MNAAQCRMARAALQLGVRELASAANVSPTTITRLEGGEPLYPRTISAIRAALETSGVAFIGETGVRLLGPASKALREREAEKQRQREAEDPYIPEVKFTPRDGNDLEVPSAPSPASHGAKEK